MGTVKPITPQEVVGKKREQLPDAVILAVNEMIVEKWNGTEASFKQDDLVARIIAKDSNLTSKILFDSHHLDFEEIYQKEGWLVEYDKPGFNETYPATFSFKRKKRAV